MRETGQTFLSFSLETDFDQTQRNGSNYAGLYLERGLSPRLTLGLDAGVDLDTAVTRYALSGNMTISKAILFLRWPLGQTDRKTPIAAEIGIGLSDNRLALRPGLSIGQGITAGKLPGWVSLDSRALLIDGAAGRFEADVTFGLSPSPKSKLIVQLQTAQPFNSPAYAKLAPSYVRHIAPGRHIELGLIAGIAKADDFKLKLGLWHQF